MTIKTLATIGVIGAGTMGSGIVLVALYAGCEVYVQDTFPQMLEKSGEFLRTYLGKKNQADRVEKFHLVSKLEELASAEIVIEAAPERLELKQEIFRKLDSVCQPSAILATNTSTLSVAAIAAATQHPKRV